MSENILSATCKSLEPSQAVELLHWCLFGTPGKLPFGRVRQDIRMALGSCAGVKVVSQSSRWRCVSALYLAFCVRVYSISWFFAAFYGGVCVHYIRKGFPCVGVGFFSLFRDEIGSENLFHGCSDEEWVARTDQMSLVLAAIFQQGKSREYATAFFMSLLKVSALTSFCCKYSCILCEGVLKHAFSCIIQSNGCFVLVVTGWNCNSL